ncbi:hypothetical protein DL98DRAFT_349537, partial [Cadophora sp. DSE1049]
MRRSKSRKPPSLHLKIEPSRETSPRCSSVLSDWDADDEGFMSSGDFLPSRPLSLAIPSGPYCPRRPTLQEVLSNTAPPPWTLTAFMQYLSQNHCLETLEFTMDAKRYEKHYRDMVDKDPHTPVSPQSPECEYVRMLWQKLLDAYIAPNGPREVNLPSNIRDHLLSQPCEHSPPDPAELDPAVKIIYELMDESVLVPFLNSVAPSRGPETYSSPWTSDESMTDAYMSGSLDERSLSPAKSRNRRDGSPPSGSDVVAQSQNGPSPRHSHQSHLTAALVGRAGVARLSTYLSGSSGTSPGEAPENMTDDSTDSPSPSTTALEPMTPPNTPPTSNIAFDVSPGTSPRTAREGNSGWKKMAPMVHGGTSLRLSEGSESPVLEAHPGSPVDLTGRRPSLTAAMAVQRLYHGSEEEFSKFERSTKAVGRKEEAITRNGVAAKGYSNGVNGGEREVLKIPKRRVTGLQPFYIPAKVPEQEEIHQVTIHGDSKMALDTSVETTAMDFDFEEDNGTWISAHPIGHESRTSLATTTTAASTLVDDRFSNGALTLDTSVASSAASMMSSAASIQSASTTTSSDIYGWEEELDRKTSSEGRHAWEREVARRLPSGGRTLGPRHRGGGLYAAGKRKSLLYRVLNLS